MSNRFYKGIHIEQLFIKNSDGCHVWQGTLNTYGYGQFFYREAGKLKSILMHRYMYEKHKGEVPEGMVVHHTCNNRQCINPEHLEVTTNKANVLAGTGLSAENARKTHCKNGHEFTPENTYKKGNARRCKICAIRSGQLSYIKRKLAQERAIE